MKSPYQILNRTIGSKDFGDILQCIISLCQKEIAMYNDVPLKHERVKLAREIMKIVNTENKKV